jgi:hypothetical protein
MERVAAGIRVADEVVKEHADERQVIGFGVV